MSSFIHNFSRARYDLDERPDGHPVYLSCKAERDSSESV